MLCARFARHLGKIATTGRGAAAVSACRYILGCKGGWRDTTYLQIEPTGGEVWDADAADVRARILAKIAAINGAPEPDSREADKGGPA
jgi:hypothetical protein